MTTPDLLPALWRQQAHQYEGDGMTQAARLLLRVSDELTAALVATGGVLVSLNEAARRSGYSAEHIGRLVRLGTLQNYGRKHAPRVRLADLPLRPTRAGVDSAARHRLVANGGTGVQP